MRLLHSTVFPLPDSPTRAKDFPFTQCKIYIFYCCNVSFCRIKTTFKFSTFNICGVFMFICVMISACLQVGKPYGGYYYILFQASVILDSLFHRPFTNIPEYAHSMVPQYRIFINSFYAVISYIHCIYIAEKCICRCFCQFFLEFIIISSS